MGVLVLVTERLLQDTLPEITSVTKQSDGLVQKTSNKCTPVASLDAKLAALARHVTLGADEDLALPRRIRSIPSRGCVAEQDYHVDFFRDNLAPRMIRMLWPIPGELAVENRGREPHGFVKCDSFALCNSFQR